MIRTAWRSLSATSSTQRPLVSVLQQHASITTVNTTTGLNRSTNVFSLSRNRVTAMPSAIFGVNSFQTRYFADWRGGNAKGAVKSHRKQAKTSVARKKKKGGGRRKEEYVFQFRRLQDIPKMGPGLFLNVVTEAAAVAVDTKKRDPEFWKICMLRAEILAPLFYPSQVAALFKAFASVPC